MSDNRNGPKEIVILSGKGGTGKTTITASLATMMDKIVMADCDVDASNLYMLLSPRVVREQDFFMGVRPEISRQECTQCLVCVDVCAFGAINGESLEINPVECEGCGVCAWFCPQDAIELVENHCGKWFSSETRFGPLVYAELFPGEENSGKLVFAIKEEARRLAEERAASHILVDGPPGIACPVISSISGADHALLVAEPTLSGLSDLERVLDVCHHFHIKASCIINRADLFPEVTHEIRRLLEEKNCMFLGELPFEKGVMDANQRLVPFVEAYPKATLTRRLEKIAARLAIL